MIDPVSVLLAVCTPGGDRLPTYVELVPQGFRGEAAATAEVMSCARLEVGGGYAAPFRMRGQIYIWADATGVGAALGDWVDHIDAAAKALDEGGEQPARAAALGVVIQRIFITDFGATGIDATTQRHARGISVEIDWLETPSGP